MRASRCTRLLVPLLLLVGVAGCTLPTDGLILAPGWRRLTITVRNTSARPAIVLIGDGGGNLGRAVGRVDPCAVLPAATVELTVDLPPAGAWAIFVNPGLRETPGPLVVPGDIPPRAFGRAPFWIEIGPDGVPVAMIPGDATGWFGS